MAFTYVTLQRVYETADDQPASGRVEFTPVDQMRNGLTVVTRTVGDDLDATGLMSIRLAATTDPATTPVGVTYRVVERLDGQTPRTYYVSVPHDQGGTLQLADLTVLTSSGAAGFALRNAVDYDDSVAPTDGQVMAWDAGLAKFHPETVTGGGGGGGGVTSVNGQTGAVTINNASLGAQPADADLTAIAALAPANGSFLERQAGVWAARSGAQVKQDLGLDQVANTSDAAKPVSAATQIALDGKAPIASPTFTGTPAAPRFVGAAVDVTYAASVTINAALGSTFRVTATGPLTIAAITNGVNGQAIRVEVLASGATRTVTYEGVPSSVPAGTWWTRRFTYNQTLGIWLQDVTGGAGVTSVNGGTGDVTITTTSIGAQPVDSDLTVIAALDPTDGSLLARQGGVWTGRTTAQVKTDMGLGNVDNTSDANKPISNATAASLAAKAPLVAPALTNPAANRFLGAVQTVTYASSVTLDASAATTFRVSATGPLTIADITNGANGQQIALEVLASGADRTLTVAGGTVVVPAGLWWQGALRYDQPIDTWKLTESAGGTTGGGGVPDDGSVTNAKVAVGAAIDLDKTADSASRLAMTPAERTKLAGAAPTASPTFTGTATAPRFVTPPTTITYAATVTPDASVSSLFRVTATGDLTIANPANPVNGQLVVVEVLASGADRSVTAAGLTFVVRAGTWAQAQLRYNQTANSWLLQVDSSTGGAEGAVFASTVDAKGDLLVGTADDVVDNLTVGSDGQVLSANSAAATGLQWITLPASTGGVNPGCVAFDSFAGASDEAKLTNALSYLGAQTYRPTLLFGNREHIFTTSRTIFHGLRMAGGATGMHTDQIRSSAAYPNRISLNTSGPWLVLPGGNIFGLSFSTLAFQGNTGSQFIQPTGSSVIWTSNFHNLSFNLMTNVFGSRSQQALFTASEFSGWWNINNGRDQALSLGGSDCSFWAGSTALLDSPTTTLTPTGQRFHMNFSGMSKSSIGPMYITAEANSGIEITGTSSGLVFHGTRVEGRNAGAPCYGALVRQTGNGSHVFRDCWFAYAMANPTGTGRTDAGYLHFTNGQVLIDGCIFDRATGVAASVPVIYAGGTSRVRVRNCRTATDGADSGNWTPVVHKVATATVDADNSVSVVNV